MKLSRKVGVTSEIWQVFVRDSSSTTGAGLAGLVFNSGSLAAYFHRDTDTAATAISLVTMTVGTYTSGGFKEIDATNMPGWYQFCPPNAGLASGAKSCGFHLKGAANMAPLPIEVDLQADANVTHLLGTAWLAPGTAGTPDVNAKLIGGTAQTGRDIGTSVLLSSGTGTGQVKLAAGYVAPNWGDVGNPTTTLNLSATTIATTQKVDVETIKTQAVTCPAGVAVGAFVGNATHALTVDSSGRVTVGSNADKTGYSLAGTPDVNVTKVAGTNQTAIDLGAVLPAGTTPEAIGGLPVIQANGYIPVDVVSWGGVFLVDADPLSAISTTLNATPAAVWAAATRTLTSGANIALAKGTGVTGFTDLDATGVRTAVGLAAANLDTQLAAKQATFTTATGVTFPTNFGSLSIDSNGRVKIQSGVVKNVAIAGFEFFMADSADHVTGKTGLTVTATRSLDGAAFGACANAVAEVSGGLYKIDLAAADLNGATVTLKFSATGADTRIVEVLTTP